jgi:uncharacterized protein
MQLNEVRFDKVLPVEGYGPGFFRIGGVIVDGPLILLPEARRGWGGLEDAAPLLALAAEADVLFIGTGAEIAHIPEDLRRALEETGLGIETMATPAACRTYNVLLSEGRRIAAALLPVA